MVVKKKVTIAFVITGILAISTMIMFSTYKSSEAYRKAKAKTQWECSVVCAEKSTPDSYVITYSDAKILSNTGVLTVQNRNDFDITVHLLCEGKQELVSDSIPAGGYVMSQPCIRTRNLKNYENENFRSAMLCIGDYLIYSKNWNFIQNESRDVSWKRLFREVNNSKFRNNISVLKDLFDEIDLKLSDKQNLQSIIKKYKPNVNDWRLEFVNNPETIKLMTYYVKFNESSSEIYLLNAPKFSSNAIDLDIYLIKKQLEKKGISSRILFDEKYWKSIIKGIGNRQSKVIHYGIKEKNFVLIQHGKEDLVFENRKKVIDYIVNSMI